jgi:hypothetical protein
MHCVTDILGSSVGIRARVPVGSRVLEVYSLGCCLVYPEIYCYPSLLYILYHPFLAIFSKARRSLFC